jgi:predicted MFS family arabinose efflux permease
VGKWENGEEYMKSIDRAPFLLSSLLAPNPPPFSPFFLTPNLLSFIKMIVPTLVKGDGIETDLQKRRAQYAGGSGFHGMIANPHVCAIAVFASLGGLVYGYNQGMFGQVLSMTSFQKASGTSGITNATLSSLITAILELGAWVGVLINGYSADKLGRKMSVVVACVVFIIGVIVQACTRDGSYSYVMGGRFVTGLGVGSLSMVSESSLLSRTLILNSKFPRSFLCTMPSLVHLKFVDPW